MSLQEKYADVLALGEKLGVRDGNVVEEDGILVVSGLVKSPYEEQKLQDKIVEVNGGEIPDDCQTDITVENPDCLHVHTVKSGDTLSAISKKYYGDAGEYNKIFKANTDQLDSADAIDVGQELIIPN